MARDIHLSVISIYMAFGHMDGSGLDKERQRRKGDLQPNLVASHHFKIERRKLRSNISCEMEGKRGYSFREARAGWECILRMKWWPNLATFAERAGEMRTGKLLLDSHP